MLGQPCVKSLKIFPLCRVLCLYSKEEIAVNQQETLIIKDPQRLYVKRLFFGTAEEIV